MPRISAGSSLLQLAPDIDLDAIELELSQQPDVESVTLESEHAQAARAAAQRQKARLVRVEQARLDHVAAGIGELTVLQSRMAELTGVTGPLQDLLHRLNLLVSELQDAVLSMRMVPIGDVFDRFPRVVRDAARTTGKDVELRIEGRDIEVDRSILDEMVDPLVHMLRNAVDHGLEGPVGRIEADKPPQGLIVLRAVRERNSVRIELEDDGRGVDAARVLEKARQSGLTVEARSEEIGGDELLRILSHPGFSTAEQITEVSGRGVGLDAVVNRVRALGGAIDLNTRAGQGSTFTIRLPFTLAVAQALHVRVAGRGLCNSADARFGSAVPEEARRPQRTRHVRCDGHGAQAARPRGGALARRLPAAGSLASRAGRQCTGTRSSRGSRTGR